MRLFKKGPDYKEGNIGEAPKASYVKGRPKRPSLWEGFGINNRFIYSSPRTGKDLGLPIHRVKEKHIVRDDLKQAFETVRDTKYDLELNPYTRTERAENRFRKKLKQDGVAYVSPKFVQDSSKKPIVILINRNEADSENIEEDKEGLPQASKWVGFQMAQSLIEKFDLKTVYVEGIDDYSHSSLSDEIEVAKAVDAQASVQGGKRKKLDIPFLRNEGLELVSADKGKYLGKQIALGFLHESISRLDETDAIAKETIGELKELISTKNEEEAKEVIDEFHESIRKFLKDFGLEDGHDHLFDSHNNLVTGDGNRLDISIPNLAEIRDQIVPIDFAERRKSLVREYLENPLPSGQDEQPADLIPPDYKYVSRELKPMLLEHLKDRLRHLIHNQKNKSLCKTVDSDERGESEALKLVVAERNRVPELTARFERRNRPVLILNPDPVSKINDNIVKLSFPFNARGTDKSSSIKDQRMELNHRRDMAKIHAGTHKKDDEKS